MLSNTLVSALLAAATPLVSGAALEVRDANCFPYGSAKLPGNYKAPSGVSRDQWWCSNSMAYGFQGFSYPLEDGDCGAYSNSYDQMKKDFAQQKKDFGATLVRMYYPVCTSSSVFENAIRAAYDNNMGLVVQVWTNFGGGDVWRDSQNAIYAALDKYKDIAPYVVHSAEFGSEPVGDGMDEGNFVQDLGKFRQKLNSLYGIKVGISEDWDRPGKMSSNDGNSLGPIGKGVKDNSDVAHIHPMPFYHFNGKAADGWAYIQKATQWVLDHTGLPTMISETQWAWGNTEHYNGHKDTGVSQYQLYWKTLDNNCEWFRDRKVGWFLHAWRNEDTFDMVKPDGSYVIPNWRPRKC